MTLAELQKLNRNFQQNALTLSEMIPSSNLSSALSELIRFARNLDVTFSRLISNVGNSNFYPILDKLEETLDEMVFIFDKIEDANTNQKVLAIKEFLMEGYSLVSVYEQCNNSIIFQNQKV